MATHIQNRYNFSYALLIWFWNCAVSFAKWAIETGVFGDGNIF